MEFLQILDRAAGAWSKRYGLTPGFKEKWVVDKTTDGAKDIKISIDGDMDSPPAVKVNDWVRILHVETKDEPMTYDSYGRPINSNQYRINGISKLWDKNEYWIVSMTLEEPIERTKGILGETLTYTNQTTKTVDGVTYSHWRGRYNHYTALERWLKVTPANCDSYEAGYDRKSNYSWFNRIKILDAAWLAGIPFENDTFNELSLYNVLMDKYDASVGRTPVMYFDIDPATDLPYNMERDEYILKFERQDGYDKPELQLSELKKDTSTETLTKILYTEDLANYATGLVANLENISGGGRVVYPAENYYAVPEVIDDVRTIKGVSTYGKDGDRDKWVVRVPHKIKNVYSVTGRSFNAFLQEILQEEYYHTEIKTLPDYPVLERKQYYSMESDDPSFDPAKFNEAYWFEEGQNYIHVKPSYFRENDDDGVIAYNIVYEPLITGKVQIGDEEYQAQVNQSSSQVDSDKFGEFLGNYLKNMNRADLQLIKTYEFYDDFKDLLGSRVIDGEKEYVITSMEYVNRKWNYDVVYQLNENHIRKNSSYRASEAIRPNIEIAYGNLKERMTSIGQTIKLGLTPQTASGNKFLNSKRAVYGALIPGVVPSEEYPQVGMLSYTDKYTTLVTERYTTLSRVAVDNKAIINFRFFDNADAGKRKIIENTKSVFTGNDHFLSEPMYQVPSLYADPFGELQDMRITLSNLAAEHIDDKPTYYPDDVTESELNELVNLVKSMANAPVPSDATSSHIIDKAIAYVRGMHYDKDMLENLNINVWFGITSDDMIVCPGLLKLSRIMQAADEHTIHAGFYSTKKNPKDDLGENLLQDMDLTGRYTTSHPTLNNVIVYDIVGRGEFASIVLYAHYADGRKPVPLLIINRQTSGNFLYIHYN